MIAPDRFVGHLRELGVEMFVGVPDSLLKAFSQYVMEALPRESHVITANEGAAVGFAAGHYLGTGKPALVYLQNSGIGNAVNPLMSLADAEVYGVPMILMIGWRGQPGIKDEPQHVKQGRVMTSMIESMELPYRVLPKDTTEAEAAMAAAVDTAQRARTPYLVLIEKGTFDKVPSTASYGLSDAAQLPSREDALGVVTKMLPDDGAIVSTTGMLSRELFELRVAASRDGARDFLTVGGMGHAAAIALGLATSGPTAPEVWCLDGDGAVLMHTGSLATIGDHGGANYHHVVFNNGVHDSVGGQPTSISNVDLPTLARSVGYTWTGSVDSVEAIAGAITSMRAASGPSLLELRVRPGARSDLGRPTRTPRESIDRFMSAVASE